MDKETIILKYIQNELNDVETNINELKQSNISKDIAIDNLENKIDEIYALLNMEKKLPEINDLVLIKPTSQISVPVITSYEELYEKSSLSLKARGLDIENLDYRDLVTENELIQIEKQFNRPLPRKEKWEKADFIAVFIAASIGSLVDIILSDRNNKFTGKNSDFSNWLDKFHKHDSGAPIDYQGKGFGGGYHRGLSKGHDILRFIEGIMMFKNGQFEGIRYVDGVAKKVVSSVNQYGNPYEQLGWIEAILKYTQHMFADMLSTNSLPFPGSSFIVECSNRELRKLAATMYHNGFNIKNVMTQSLSTIIIEVIVRVYFSIKSVQNSKESFEISDGYLNYETIKTFIKPNSKEKLYEMLLMSHSIVSAINIGKVVIKKSPWEINVTEIISVVRYSIPVVNGLINRNSEHAKLMRNSEEVHQGWEQLASEINLQEIEEEYMIGQLIIE